MQMRPVRMTGALTFAVKMQAQFDSIFSAVTAGTQLVIDPVSAIGNLAIKTENRNVYVHLPPNGTYKGP